jgi:hypothetical protein
MPRNAVPSLALPRIAMPSLALPRIAMPCSAKPRLAAHFLARAGTRNFLALGYSFPLFPSFGQRQSLALLGRRRTTPFFVCATAKPVCGDHFPTNLARFFTPANFSRHASHPVDKLMRVHAVLVLLLLVRFRTAVHEAICHDQRGLKIWLTTRCP